MDLKTYNKKRNFSNTPEPKGEIQSPVKALRFVVQKHNASKLHYDFRLELDGVLKSWAIPKGPSLNPADKRLAMAVEDHPVSYKDFEGTIPEGNYGAGEVIVWDRGIYHAPGTDSIEESEEIIRKGLSIGNVSFILQGEKLKGEFSLVKTSYGGRNAWLLIKKKDNFASEEDISLKDKSVISSRVLKNSSQERKITDNNKTLLNSRKEGVIESSFNKIKPMLATLVKEPFNDKNWIFETKWDGYRTVAEIYNKEIILFSRKNNSFNNKYPEIVKALKNLKHNVILDGEVVVMDSEGRSNFQLLQNYPGTKKGKIAYCVFDILSLDGKDLRNTPLIERKKILKEILPHNDLLIYSDFITGEGISFFNKAVENRQEGIIAKKADSIYQNGKRSHDWQKIKTHLRQEAVICGFTDPRGAREYFGALVLGVYDENKDLRYVGHAGGGFDKESLIDVYSRLKSLVQKQSPFKDPPKTNMPVKWVKPELVCEVSFSEWTEDGQLRQPIFEGLREDKKAEDVVREKYSDISKIKDKNSLPNERIIGKDDSSSGKKLILTNLKKIYWPQEGITKGDLIEYYKIISKYMLPYLKNRPHTLLRHPNGINEESFFQKDLGETAPEWIQTVNILSESNRREVRYLVCTNKASLLYMVNLGCIEINPWSSKINKLDNPDYMVIDLDPLEIEFEKVIQTALVVKEVLDQAKVKSYCKTSGSTGLHIYVPLKGNYEFDVVKKFAHMIAKMVNQKLPEITSLERSPAKRRGKVYIDYLQNKIGSTVAAPYSVRPRAGAPVSAPLLWKEVKTGLNPDKFTIKNIIKRLKKNGDFFKGVLGPGINIIKSVKNLEIAQTLKQKPITIKT